MGINLNNIISIVLMENAKKEGIKVGKLVYLKGIVNSEGNLISPCLKSKCVYYKSRIYEILKDKNGKDFQKNIKKFSDSEDFYLKVNGDLYKIHKKSLLHGSIRGLVTENKFKVYKDDHNKDVSTEEDFQRRKNNAEQPKEIRKIGEEKDKDLNVLYAEESIIKKDMNINVFGFLEKNLNGELEISNKNTFYFLISTEDIISRKNKYIENLLIQSKILFISILILFSLISLKRKIKKTDFS